MKLNLGSGLDYREGWINVDANKSFNPDLNENICTLSSIKLDSVDMIELFATLEHLHTWTVIDTLKRWHEIGKEGCILSVHGIPDFDRLIDLYREGKLTLAAKKGYGYIERWIVGCPSNVGDNSENYFQIHKALWTKDRVRVALKEAGWNLKYIRNVKFQNEQWDVSINFLAVKGNIEVPVNVFEERIKVWQENKKNPRVSVIPTVIAPLVEVKSETVVKPPIIETENPIITISAPIIISGEFVQIPSEPTITSGEVILTSVGQIVCELKKVWEEALKDISSSDWGLPYDAVEALVTEVKPCKVWEFGGGFSSLVLNKMGYDSIIFEHDIEWSNKLKKLLGDKVLLFPLRQIDNRAYKRLFVVKNPLKSFQKIGEIISKSRANETRIKNAFYDIKEWNFESPNLIIADGPHGNGRSILWPLLRGKLVFPVIVLVDDINHYPFLEELGKVFDFKHIIGDGTGKGWALIELLSGGVVEMKEV